MTPDQAYAVAFELVWLQENGPGDAILATETPGDPGGYTRGGVALDRHPELTRAQLDAMTKSDFQAWYRANYWTPHGCDELPWPVCLAVFDGEVNEGGEGAMALQAALGVPRDGVVGPRTIAAAKQGNPSYLAARTMAERDAAYHEDSDFSTFGLGWITRLFDVAFLAGGVPS